MLQDESGSGDTVSNGVSSADAHPFALADVEACSVAVPSGDACSVAVRSGDACSAAALVVRVAPQHRSRVEAHIHLFVQRLR